MYKLPHFQDPDQQELVKFMQDHPFAFLSGVNENNEPVATQVPLLLEERNGKLFLLGHIMRKTDHHLAFESNSSVLVVFTGPHVYVSATWYKNPHQASTWNYMSVHARGKLKFTPEATLIELLKRLTLYFENNDGGSTTIYDNLPEDYRSSLVKAIIGFEIEVEHLDHVFKLSQNRDEESFGMIMEKLEKLGDEGRFIASEMQKRKNRLYSHEK